MGRKCAARSRRMAALSAASIAVAIWGGKAAAGTFYWDADDDASNNLLDGSGLGGAGSFTSRIPNVVTFGDNTGTVSSATGISVGMGLYGNPNIADGTTITAITGTNITLSQTALSSGTSAVATGIGTPSKWWDGAGTSATNDAFFPTKLDTAVFTGTGGAVSFSDKLWAGAIEVRSNGYSLSGRLGTGGSLTSITVDDGTSGTASAAISLQLDYSNNLLSAFPGGNRWIVVGDNDTLTVAGLINVAAGTFIKQGGGAWVANYTGTNNNGNSINYQLDAGVLETNTIITLSNANANSRLGFSMTFNGGLFRVTGDTVSAHKQVISSGKTATYDIAEGATYRFYGTNSAEGKTLIKGDDTTTLLKTGSGTLEYASPFTQGNGTSENFRGNVVIAAGTVVVDDDVALSNFVSKQFLNSGTTNGRVDLVNDLFYSTAHGLKAGDKICTVYRSGTVDPLLTDYTLFYVVNPTANNFQLSATPGGTPLDLTSSGQVILSRVSTLGVSTNGAIVLGDASSDTNAAAFLTGSLVPGVSAGQFRVERDITVAANGGAATVGGRDDVSSTFAGNIILSKSVNLTSAATGSNAVTFSGAISGVSAGVTKVGGGIAVLAHDNSYGGGTAVQAGTLVASSPGAIPAGPISITGNGRLQLAAPGTTLLADGLTIDTSGTNTAMLDLGQNRVQVLYSGTNSPIADITAKVIAGRNSGTAGDWSGVSGITSSSIGTNSANFAVGVTDVPAAGTNSAYVLARYTFAGDANCDGNVNVGDLGILATNYGLTEGVSWAQGDFNFDGNVNVGDLGILATNYGSAGLMAEALALFPNLAAAVPEPAALGIVTLGLAGLWPRRRRT